MSERRTPSVASWLLNRLGYTRQNSALVGDLLEEFDSGRSRGWYWRQTVLAIASGVRQNLSLVDLSAFVVIFAFEAASEFLRWRFGDRVHIIMNAAGWLGFLMVAGFFVIARKRRGPIRSKMAQRGLFVCMVLGAALNSFWTSSQGSSIEMRIFEDFKQLAVLFLLTLLFAPLSKPGAVK